MKRNFSIIIAALVLIISCKSKDALNYSDKIVAKEKSLEAAIKDIERKVSDFNRENKMDSIVAVSERMVSLVDSKLTEIKNETVPNAKGAEDFKKAAVNYFEYIKEVYVAYLSYGKASTEEQKTIEVERIKDMVSKKEDIVRDMQNAQKKYADANGFKVE